MRRALAWRAFLLEGGRGQRSGHSISASRASPTPPRELPCQAASAAWGPRRYKHNAGLAAQTSGWPAATAQLQSSDRQGFKGIISVVQRFRRLLITRLQPERPDPDQRPHTDPRPFNKVKEQLKTETQYFSLPSSPLRAESRLPPATRARAALTCGSCGRAGWTMWPLAAASPCGSGASGSCHCGWAPWLLRPADTDGAKGGGWSRRGCGALPQPPKNAPEPPAPGLGRDPVSAAPSPGPALLAARSPRAGLRAAPGHGPALGTAPGGADGGGWSPPAAAAPQLTSRQGKWPTGKGSAGPERAGSGAAAANGQRRRTRPLRPTAPETPGGSFTAPAVKMAPA